METQGVTLHNDSELGTIVHIVVDKVYAGNILIADEIKEDALDAVKGLRDLGIKRIVMLTGDNSKVAEKVAGILGVDQVFSQLLPEDKVEKLETIREKVETVTSICRGWH